MPRHVRTRHLPTRHQRQPDRVAQIDINGKFLGASLNGVHRTAAHFTRQLLRRASAEHEVRLLAPKAFAPPPEFPTLRPVVAKGLLGAGQGWEWLTLPYCARNRLLVNFCNLAPLAHSNSAVMIHDAQTFLYPGDYSGRQAAAYRRLLPAIGRRARRIFTVSEFSRQSLAAHGIGALEKIDVIHNGTDHLLSVPEDPGIVARLGLQQGQYVLTMGSSKAYKNIRAVFAALQSPLAGGQRLVVAGGPGREAYLAAGWTPPPDTVFTGFVSDGELRALHARAGAFVFPSLTEGFGLPPIEAMHCGAPTICANAGAMPEVCGSAALLVPAEDPRAYREALETVLTNHHTAQDLVTRGSLRAAALSWEAAGERLYDCIRQLAA
jgi:glycosyltransferase involved in cell wall biosynthesis